MNLYEVTLKFTEKVFETGIKIIKQTSSTAVL